MTIDEVWRGRLVKSNTTGMIGKVSMATLSAGRWIVLLEGDRNGRYSLNELEVPNKADRFIFYMGGRELYLQYAFDELGFSDEEILKIIPPSLRADFHFAQLAPSEAVSKLKHDEDATYRGRLTDMIVKCLLYLKIYKEEQDVQTNKK